MKFDGGKNQVVDIMKIRILTLFAFFSISLLASVTSWGASQDSEAREQWMTEIRQYKRVYMSKELDLTREQQHKFHPLYEEMTDQIAKVNDDARVMERRVAELSNATDLEYEKATEAIYDAAVRSAEIERDYMGKFKEILSNQQLFRLKSVERQFNREMMKQHHRLRAMGKVADK